MNRLIKTSTMLFLVLTASTVLAAPAVLITHNNTPYESNAYTLGVIPSKHPTPAYGRGEVPWSIVAWICASSGQPHICKALIKMETNTSHPVDLGWVTLNLDTGEITPKSLSQNGYTLVVNGPGETTLSKN